VRVKKNANKMDVLSQYKNYLFGSKKSSPKLVVNWLLDENFGDIRKVIKGISKYKVYEKFIFGNPLPKTYEELGLNNHFGYSGDINKLLFWFGLTFEYFQKEINAFLSLKEEFEKSLLLGDYFRAEEILEKIENEICVSLWTIENRLIIAEFDQGLEKNKEILSEINNNKSNSIVSFMADFYSRKTEKNISVQKYHETLNKYLSKFFNYEDIRLVEYFNYRLNFPNYGHFTCFPALIFPELSFSIIDRYMSFIHTCKYILSKDIENIELLHISDIVSKLKLFIKDQNLQNLYVLCNPNNYSETTDDSIKVLEIIDHYTEGDYLSSFFKSKDYMSILPNCIELFEIYLKSLLRLGKDYEPPIDGNCIANDVCLNLFNVLQKNERSSDSISFLRKLTTILGNSNFNNQLFSIIQESPNNDFSRRFLELNSSINNPRMAHAYDDYKKGILFLDRYKEILNKECSTVEFFKTYFIACLEPSKDIKNLKISKQRRDIYHAKILQYHKQFNEAILIYKSILINEPSILVYVYEDIITSLFECLLSIESIDEALDLFVNNFLNNKYLINRMDIQLLLKKIDQSDRRIYRNINVPIFYHCYYSRINGNGKIYASYANFLSYYDIVKPSEIEIIENEFTINKLIYFLRYICIPEVMDSSIYFDNTEEIDIERIKICQFLTFVDKENSDLYFDEISSISKRTLLRKRIQEIDESKIFVDIKGIEKLAGQRLLESFNRYYEITKFTSEENYKVLDLMENLKVGFKDLFGNDVDLFIVEPNSKGLMRASKSQQFIAYKELFYEVRDYFISSNEYGLDTYLSIKIRHGTFLNHVRSVFKAENLITEKNKLTGNYVDNTFWNERIEVELQDEANSLLKEFSKSVDDIISNVSSKWLQIKTEDKNPEGLFNYTYFDSEIYKSMLKHKGITSHLELIHNIINELWFRTEDNLEIVRKKISGELKRLLLQKLNELELALKILFDENGQNVDLLFRSIARCGTGLQNQIERVSQWFTIIENKTMIDFNIEELLETCLELTRTIYPNTSLSVESLVKCKSLYKGTTFTHFVDILSILLDNVVKYSEDLSVSVKFVEENGVLSISFNNKISNLLFEERETYFEKIEDIKRKINTNFNDDKIKKEGGSGFYKVMKILKYDLLVHNASMFIELLDDNLFEVKLNLSTERIVQYDAGTNN
jgi:hypothetical protein